MKKKILIIIGVIVVLAIIGTVVLIKRNVEETVDAKPASQNPISDEELIKTNEQTVINSLVTYGIEGTTDTFRITEPVKWEVPSIPEATTVSFSLTIPYVITKNGVEYKGSYIIGSSSAGKGEDTDPKCPYNVKVTNLNKYGYVTVVLKEKSIIQKIF